MTDAANDDEDMPPVPYSSDDDDTPPASADPGPIGPGDAEMAPAPDSPPPPPPPPDVDATPGTPVTRPRRLPRLTPIREPNYSDRGLRSKRFSEEEDAAIDAFAATTRTWIGSAEHLFPLRDDVSDLQVENRAKRLKRVGFVNWRLYYSK